MRQQANVGKNVMYVYDRAAIDFPAWNSWKKIGIYFVSREKLNSRLETRGVLLYDVADQINAGIISDEVVGSANSGSMIRRITYLILESNEIMTFLTNAFDGIPPGVIVYLYKRRWDIEKIFDTLKHSYHEKKAWASGDVAKTMQANFICLQHHLACLFESHISLNLIVGPQHKRAEKRVTQLEEEMAKRKPHGNKLNTLCRTITRLTQHPLKYLRWLRVTRERNLPIIQAERLLECHLKLNL